MQPLYFEHLPTELSGIDPGDPIARSLGSESMLHELTLYATTVEVEQPGIELLQLFNTQPLLPGVVLKSQENFVGMISRRHFFEQMSRPFSLELFSRRSLQIFQQVNARDPLILSSHQSIVSAAAVSLRRSPELLYEPIVVRSPQNDYFLVDVHQLLLAQSHIHQIVSQALQHSQSALIAEKELAQTTLQSIGDAVITTNAHGIVQSLNPVAERLTGWQAQEAIGLSLPDVFHLVDEHTHQPIVHWVEPLFTENQTHYPRSAYGVLISRTRQRYAIAQSVAPIRVSAHQTVGAVLVFRDVTHERELAQKLAWQAHHDALTGLLNRRAFEHRLQQVCDTQGIDTLPHILCYLDLDRFKIVNDTCGHLAGDELLRQVSLLLERQMQDTDTLSRLGGDEFGILLHPCPLERGIAIAEHLRQQVQDFRFVWQDNTFTIGVSIGLTLVDSHRRCEVTQLMRQADTACYLAKHQGRNCVHVYQEDREGQAQGRRDVQWVTRITQALENDSFQLYYQPMQAIAPQPDSRLHGEILLRLVDCDEVILPQAFLPAAERYNLMPAIDRWVVQHVFAHYQFLAAQEQDGRSVPCMYTINLSGASLNESGLTDFLREQLVCYAVPPETICFEITETVAIANFSQTIQLMQDLKHLGCRFALDDFGSGMSSFAYLKNLPVDYLKIDGNLVREICTDAIACEMVEAINRIGHVIPLKTIAEHVENEAILQKLRAIGVDYGQGDGISPPQPLFSPLEW